MNKTSEFKIIKAAGEERSRETLCELLKKEMLRPTVIIPMSEQVEIVPLYGESLVEGMLRHYRAQRHSLKKLQIFSSPRNSGKSFWYEFIRKFGHPISMVGQDRMAGATRNQLWSKYPQLTRSQIRKSIRGLPRGKTWQQIARREMSVAYVAGKHSQIIIDEVTAS